MLKHYLNLLDELHLLNSDAEAKAIDGDSFITNNINFFTKAFTITICAYLETFIKDLSYQFINHCNEKLSTISIAHNIVKWSVTRKESLIELKESDLKFENLRINITREDLDDFVSGNPFRTEKLFMKFGIKLSNNQDYVQIREKIMSIVNKRNLIIHHNDMASDLSFSDIRNNIQIIKNYLKILNLSVNSAYT